jgi:hypothetical protein
MTPLGRSRYRNPDNDPRGPYVSVDITAPFDRPIFQYEWYGKVPPAGRAWRYSKDKAFELEADGRIQFSSSGRITLKRFLSEVGAQDISDSLPIAPSGLEIIVRAAMRGIAIAIAENPMCLQDVEWRDLERVLREVFEKIGFVTRLTRSGKDGGFDLELHYSDLSGNRTFLVEVKHWAGSGKKPGRTALKSLIDVIARAADGTTGLLLSSTGFTADVMNGRAEVEQYTIRLGGQSKIVSLCQNYLQCVSGLWTPTTDLAEMLLQGTM